MSRNSLLYKLFKAPSVVVNVCVYEIPRSNILEKLRLICIAACVGLLIFLISASRCDSQPRFPIIQFLGGTQIIGGSSYLIDTGNTRLLIDFGLFHGEHKEKNSVIEFDPATVDYVLLTHAHNDHSGRIPFLYRKGFKGKTVGTEATKALTAVVLKMNLGIAEKEGGSLYDYDDYEIMMKNFMVVPYGQMLRLNQEISVRFKNAGHIIGSAIIELWIKSEDGTLKVVATGDMGNESLSLLKGPDVIYDSDYVLVESTYGTAIRSNSDAIKFGREIEKTLKAGGSVLIPAFVLDRTQNVLYAIGTLKRRGIISEGTPVYVDSRTAQEITKIYRKYVRFFKPEVLKQQPYEGELFNFPHLYEVSSREALAMHERGSPAIYVTSSSMLEYSNAPIHLAKMVDNSKNLLAVVGWQAPGTLGWQLQKGKATIRIPVDGQESGKTGISHIEKPVRMKVKSFSLFSSHADACQILEWLSNFSKLKEVYVVHGEKQDALELADMITKRLGFKASVPQIGQTSLLSIYHKDYQLNKINDLCVGLRPPKK